MRTRDLVRYAAGGLRGHRLRSGLSLTGVAIGVAAVILLTSLGEGARLFVTGEFTSLGSNLLIIIPGKTETLGFTPFVNSTVNDLTVEDAEAVARRVPAVGRTAPLSLGTAAAEFDGHARDVTVIGTTSDMREIRQLTLGGGRFLPEGVRDAPVCVIGARIQRELFGGESPLGKTLRVGEARFRVIGIVASTGTSVGLNMDEVVFVPVDNGLRLFNRSSLFRIMADVGQHEQVTAARNAVIAVLKERHGGQEDVTVLTQDAVLATFNRILGILTAALAGIAAISLTVAGIGIMNVMLVSVSERTREIGLLMALGLTRARILTLFLVEAAVLSTAGGLIGLAVGLGIGRVVSNLAPDFDMVPPTWAVVSAVTVSVAIGVLFGAFPARNATRLDPVEALMRSRA